MDIEKLIEDLRGLLKQYGEKIPYGELVGAPWPYSRAGDLVWPDPEPYFIEQAATALSMLQVENEKLRAELEQAKAERDAAVEAVKNMAEYIVCAGRVDYYLCDEISQEHHLKYQPKNDGNYDNEPCYKCIADWFLQGHEWQENCW